MDPLKIFERLSERGRFPIEAIDAARENRDPMVRLILERLQLYSDTSAVPDDQEANSLFVAVHLLAEWREKTAYRPLARLLRRPDDVVARILDDDTAQNAHRIMAAVFDGDPGPLQDIVCDPAADEFVRKRMFDSLTMLTMRGDLPQDDMVQFLQTCFSQLEPQQDCYVWQGWVDAIMWLRLAELKPLAKKVFARGSIPLISAKEFEKELRYAFEHPQSRLLAADDELAPFGDAIEELNPLARFQSQRPMQLPSGWPGWGGQGPERNPLRHVGRNDPCPCGSGKKYKKCCLNADRDAAAGRPQ